MTEISPDLIDYAGKLATVFCKRHRIPRDLADDVRSCAFLGLCMAARNYDPTRGVALKTFAFSSINGAMCFRVRMDLKHPQFEEFKTVMGGSWDDLDGELMRRRLVRAIRDLPERQRTVAWLYFFEDAAPLEIQKRTGIGHRQVQWLKENAVKLMREELVG